ncbi:hypothetical protein pipiens_015676 [Culex pipiens pipiens]|uniref:Band 7 domain-containing protein n=3 Tax=Culex pipiens TaxID=7175 RepID=A0ABD1CPD5_CULPP
MLLMIFFGSKTAGHKLKTLERLVLVCFLIHYFLLCESYLAIMLSYMLNTKYQTHLQTLDELEQSSLSICLGSENGLAAYKNFFNVVSPKLADRVVIKNFSKHWYDVESCSWVMRYEVAEVFLVSPSNHERGTMRRKMYVLPQMLTWLTRVHSVSRLRPFGDHFGRVLRRLIEGTLTVEEVYKDRDQFAALVREVAAPDVGRMGIEILSFTIKDVYDDVQYLQSLGKAQTASVKRDADAGVAEANRDAGIREAECEKSAMDVKYSTDTKIEDNARMYKLQKANFDQEINTAKAESQLAYELQAAKIRQRIRNEEIQIDIVERRKQIEIETQEINRKDCELSATVKLPAEAESYRVQMIAEGKRTQTVEVAKAEAERIRKIGAAEAHAIEMVGKAEAERMRMKANVYKQYGDAAIMNIVLESLPKIAAEVAAPLAKTEEIVLISGNDSTTADVARLVGQLPPAINALTGVDLSKVLGKIPGAKA